MHYRIKVSEVCGDNVPLSYVAHAIAHSSATLGRPEFSTNAYNAQIGIWTQILLDAARNGSLKVCDSEGMPATVESIVSSRKEAGTLVNVFRNGSSDLDVDATTFNCLRAKLDLLNRWAESRGDAFLISDEFLSWGDETSWIEPPKNTGGKATRVGSDRKPEIGSERADDSESYAASGLDRADQVTGGDVVGKTAHQNVPAPFIAALERLLKSIEGRDNHFDRKMMPGTCANLHALASKTARFPTTSVSTFQKYQKTSGLCKFGTHAVSATYYRNLFPELFK